MLIMETKNPPATAGFFELSGLSCWSAHPIERTERAELQHMHLSRFMEAITRSTIMGSGRP
jgi:hypothetical protein